MEKAIDYGVQQGVGGLNMVRNGTVFLRHDLTLFTTIRYHVIIVHNDILVFKTCYSTLKGGSQGDSKHGPPLRVCRYQVPRLEYHLMCSYLLANSSPLFLH